MAKETFSFRLSDDLRRRLWDAAEADHRPVGDWLRLLIERELASREDVVRERARMVGKVFLAVAFSVVALNAVPAFAQYRSYGEIIESGRGVTEYRANRNDGGGVFITPGVSVQEYRAPPLSSYGDRGGVSRDYGAAGYGLEHGR